jgi:hypothetical protein
MHPARPASDQPELGSVLKIAIVRQWLAAAIRARSEQSVLSFSASRSSFLIEELLLGKLGETVVVVGNAPHDRPASSCVIWSATVRACSARKRQC